LIPVVSKSKKQSGFVKFKGMNFALIYANINVICYFYFVKLFK